MCSPWSTFDWNILEGWLDLGYTTIGELCPSACAEATGNTDYCIPEDYVGGTNILTAEEQNPLDYWDSIEPYQEIWQSGGLMPEIVWEPNYSGNVLEWMNSEGLGNNIFSTAIECQINSNCSYAGQAMSAESAIDLLPTGPNWSIEDVDLGEISGWIGSLPWPPLNDPSLPDLINEGIKNNLKSRLQKLAGIKKRG